MQMCPTWTNIRGRNQELSFSGEGWWPSGISSFPGLSSQGNPGIVFFTPLPAYWWEIGSSPHYNGNYSRHLPRVKYDFGVILDPPKGVSGLSWRLSGRESYMGTIPGLGRSLGEGNGNPLQYSCLENPWTEEPGRLQSMGLQKSLLSNLWKS